MRALSGLGYEGLRHAAMPSFLLVSQILSELMMWSEFAVEGAVCVLRQ